MWQLEIAFAIGILIGTLCSIVVPGKKWLDRRYRAIPFIFACGILVAGYAYIETGEFFGITQGFSHSMFLLAIFCASFFAIVLNLNRLRFPIDELLYVTQLSIASFLFLYLSQDTHGYSLFLSMLPSISIFFIPLMMNTTSKNRRLLFTALYMLVSSGVIITLLLYINFSASIAQLSTSAVDLTHAFLLGWVFVAYLIPICMLVLFVFAIPNPRIWPDIGGNIYHYFVFIGRHHGLALILLWAGILVVLQLATFFMDALTAITYVLVVAYAASYYLHRGGLTNHRSRRTSAQSS